LRAIVKRLPAPGVEVADVPKPRPGPGEVVIEVQAAAICGSDLGIYRYTEAYSGMKLPVVLGHELAGVVSEVGPGVEGVEPGERVVSESVWSCGECQMCLGGHPNLCEDTKVLGIHIDGGFAEYVKVPERLLHPIPQHLGFDQAALVEPLSNAVHFVHDLTPFHEGDLVVVHGCGPIGLLSAQLFQLGGAQVLVSGLESDGVRLAIAGELGLETVVVGREDLVERVMDETGGRGADVAFVAVGAPQAAQQAIQLVKKRGRVTLVGIFEEPTPLDLTRVVRREVSLHGAYDAKPPNFQASIDLITRGRVEVGKLITHRFPLEEAEEAFQTALNRLGGKILFKPQQG